MSKYLIILQVLFPLFIWLNGFTLLYVYSKEDRLLSQIAQADDEESTSTPSAFEFTYPRAGWTVMKIHFLPMPEIANSLRALLGGTRNTRIARIENNETLIDTKNGLVAAFMKHNDDTSGEVIELAYVLRGVTRNIALQILTGSMFAAYVDSKVIVRKKSPDGRIISLVHSADTTSEVKAEAFMRVTKIKKGKRTNRMGQVENVVLVSGQGKVRLTNALVKIAETQTFSESSLVPIIVFVFDFEDCPTIVGDRAVSQIEKLIGEIESVGTTE